MSIQVANPNNVQVYTVAGTNTSRAIPDWLARKNRRLLKTDLEWRHRVELLQDFGFPEAALRIRTTRDGKYAVATGVYKPQMRVYDFAELSMKFDRHTDAENVTFEILSDDWTKSILLQADRSIEFHAQGGIHYRTRIPSFGRDLTYHYPGCEVFIGASGDQVYRMNLERGQFLTPYDVGEGAGGGVNAIEINPAHNLLTLGTEGGVVQLWDVRSRTRVASMTPHLPAGAYAPGQGTPEITALAGGPDGLSLAVGTGSGHVLMYDLREAKPYLTKDQQYGLPIHRILYHTHSRNMVSADAKSIKLWDQSTGKHFVTMEPTTDINDVAIIPDSGLVLAATEGIQMHGYYIPELGPAPRWCAFLDNLTEEMEENGGTSGANGVNGPMVYEDYKFVTKSELTRLGLDHLVGTPTLKAYMHGYFLSLALYEKARLIANPFAYEEHRKQRARDKIEKTRASRIRSAKALPAVNKELAAKWMEESAEVGKVRGRKGKKAADASNLLQDERFKGVFQDEDFAIDTESKAYALANPMAAANAGTSAQAPRGYRIIDSDEEEEEGEEEGEKDSEMESGGEEGEDSSDEDDLLGYRTMQRQKMKQKGRGPRTRMYEQDEEGGGGSRGNRTFGERMSKRMSR